jgi:hypothetical protein
MRVTVAILSVVLAAVLGRFFWDDVISGEDVPRGVVVEEISIGNTDRATAGERLDGQLALEGDLTLTFQGEERTQSYAKWGVTLDIDATIDQAASMRGGGVVRFFRWSAAVVRDRTTDPVWTIDSGILADQFDDDALGVVFEASAIELVDDVFVSIQSVSRPVVDTAALERALSQAIGSGDATIEVPISGVEQIAGDDALAVAANELTADDITVALAGTLDVQTISWRDVRGWLEVAGATSADDFSFDPSSVQSTLADVFPDVGLDGVDGVQFLVGFDGNPILLGALEGSMCCAEDTADHLFTTLGSNEPVTVFPLEAADARGLQWAATLGINELVGEFTTFYKPNQTRNINIARISEITRGVIIEPGETFSVNDYVGRRTTADGFVSAGVISNGVFSSSVGGGISQYATTVFNAAFFAGLDFGEYQSHSIYISRYPFGREATVSFPAPDLQIVNTTPYGVLLWPTTNDDSITVRLYSTAYVTAEQTAQTSRTEGTACTRVHTERTRTYVDDGRVEVDSVTARYRPEGINCAGGSTRPTTTTTTTTIPTTVP